jgi:hypothetical protein
LEEIEIIMKRIMILTAAAVFALALGAQAQQPAELLVPYEDYLALDMPKLDSGFDKFDKHSSLSRISDTARKTTTRGATTS